MTDSGLTLNQFFSLEKKPWRERLSTVESGGLKDRISKQAGVGWPMAIGKVAEKLTDILDVSLVDIMVAAWNKYGTLLKYLDQEKYPPDETVLVPLVEHTIKSEHRPSIEILINDQPVGKLQFDIAISLAVKGIVLKIRDGKIKEIITGTCKGKGTIKCENAVILEKETQPIPLPGFIDLGKGIPIRAIAVD